MMERIYITLNACFQQMGSPYRSGSYPLGHSTKLVDSLNLCIFLLIQTIYRHNKNTCKLLHEFETIS